MGGGGVSWCYCFLPPGGPNFSPDPTENPTVSDASALCEQTTSPTNIGFRSVTSVRATCFNSAPSLESDTAIPTPVRTTFSLYFPGPSNGRSKALVFSPLLLRH